MENEAKQKLFVTKLDKDNNNMKRNIMYYL